MATGAGPNEVWEVVLEGRLHEQQCLNVMYFHSGLGSDDVETRLLRALIICVLTNLIPGLSSDYVFVGAKGKRVAPTLGPVIEMSPLQTDDVVGNTAGDSLPSVISALISIHTTRGGRSGRGRIFLAGIPEAGTIGSNLNIEGVSWPAILNFIACIAAQFFQVGDPPQVNQWQFGVMSRKIGGAKPPFLEAGFAPATRLVAKQLLATTRSRKVGRGS